VLQRENDQLKNKLRSGSDKLRCVQAKGTWSTGGAKYSV
jgi:hypothetical protein